MLLSSTNFLFWKARRELWGGLTTRCFPSKEDKDMFMFCSPFNLSMYIINKLFDERRNELCFENFSPSTTTHFFISFTLE